MTSTSTYNHDANNNNDSSTGGTYRTAPLTTTHGQMTTTALTPTLTSRLTIMRTTKLALTITTTHSFHYNFDHTVTNRTYDLDKNNNNDSREGGTYMMAALTTMHD